MLRSRDMRSVALPAALGFAVALALSAGCRCGAPTTAPAGAGSAAPTGSAGPPPAETAPPPAAAATQVQLPRSADAPVTRTTRPLDRTQLDRLAAIEFPDFEREDRGGFPGLAEFRHTTRTRPRLAVTVTVATCAAPRTCRAMDLAAWTARRDELMRGLPEALRHRPDTRFEITARAISGAPAIAVYELGYATGSDEHGQPSIDYIDAYVLHYNDGVNQLRVMANYVDDTSGGIDQLLALAPREDLEKLAVAFASYYAHAWNDR